jgi:hypothetical protein
MRRVPFVLPSAKCGRKGNRQGGEYESHSQNMSLTSDPPPYQ